MKSLYRILDTGTGLFADKLYGSLGEATLAAAARTFRTGHQYEASALIGRPNEQLVREFLQRYWW